MIMVVPIQRMGPPVYSWISKMKSIDAQTVIRIVTYITSGLILILGIVVLTGFMLPDYIPSNFRLMLGVLMVLYSIYRIVMVSIKRRSEEDE